MLYVREARFTDVLPLANRLRFEDARELAAAWGVGPREGLMCCVLASDRAFAICRSGVPVALWGITGTCWAGNSLGIPWLLAADELFRHKRQLIRQSRRWVSALQLDYHVLTNLADARNAAHLRWLEWCGFRVLREHACRGAGRSGFVEFYRINGRCQGSEAALVASLISRNPADTPSGPDPALRQGAGLALSALSEDPAGCPHALGQLLTWLEHDARCDGGVRPAALVRLASELAQRGGRGPASPERGGGDLEALCANADILLQMQLLDDCHAPTGLAFTPRPSQPSADAAEFRRTAAEPRAVSELDALARAYMNLLAGAGSPQQGYRLRTAALGLDLDEMERPLGMPRPVLEAAFRERAVARLLAANAPGGPNEPVSQRRPLPEPALDHGAVLARLCCAWPGGSRLRRQVESTLERLWLEEHETAHSPVANLAAASDLASAVAEHMALELLPRRRLGAVVADYRPRHGLYRLLRARLLEAVLESPALLSARLEEEVLALLLAWRFESALLEPAVPGWTERLVRLEAECLELLGPGARSSHRLLALLRPVVRHPVAHGGQLDAALVVWDLACTERLCRTAWALEDLFTDSGPLQSRGLRRFLRRLGARVDLLSVRSHLGLEALETGHAEHRAAQ